MKPLDILNSYFKTDFTHCNQLLETVFIEYAFEALDETQMHILLEEASVTQVHSRQRQMFSKKFIESWKSLHTTPLSNDPRMIIEHMLKWPSFARYLELHCELISYLELHCELISVELDNVGIYRRQEIIIIIINIIYSR